MEFRFELQLDQAEQVRATRIMYHRRWSTRAMYGFFVLLVLVVSGLYLHDLWRGSEGWALGVAVVGAASAAGVVTGYMSPYWTVRGLRKGNRAAEGPHTYRLSDNGIDVKSPGATSSIEWANVAEAYETKEFLLFYIAKGWAVLLPKRVVAPEQLPEVRSAIRGWVAERANLLTPDEGGGKAA